METLVLCAKHTSGGSVKEILTILSVQSTHIANCYSLSIKLPPEVCLAHTKSLQCFLHTTSRGVFSTHKIVSVSFTLPSVLSTVLQTISVSTTLPVDMCLAHTNHQCFHHTPQYRCVFSTVSVSITLYTQCANIKGMNTLTSSVLITLIQV